MVEIQKKSEIRRPNAVIDTRGGSDFGLRVSRHCLGVVLRLTLLPVSDQISHNGSSAQNICLGCGLCCNGTIFADVKLGADETAAPLQSLGMPLLNSTNRSGWKFLQPCAAFDGCRCRIYASRPQHCRHFDCLLLNKVQKGETTPDRALRVIRTARKGAEEVRELLNALGDTNDGLALSARVRRLTRRFNRSKPDRNAAEVYGQLTLAFHGLNLTLSKEFYPRPMEQ
jgi:hypothetical protein